MAKRQFTAEEKTQIVLEGMTTSISIAELCRKHSIYETQFYKWREEFVAAGRQRFEAAGSNDIVKAKDKEIAKLKELVGDLTLINDALKKTQAMRKK
jgi:transposase